MPKLDSLTVGKRYAKALFDLTHADQTDETVLADLLAIQTVLSGNPDLLTVLTSVRVDGADKQQLLNTLTKDATPIVQHLVDMLYQNNRIIELPVVIRQYQALVDQAQRRLTADVTTAVALDDQQRMRLRQKLMQIFEMQTVVLNEKVDETIIGGVKIKAANRVLDGSLATKLANIRQSMKR